MKASGIGGQAVLEGVMMQNRDRYAVSVRKPDGTIQTKVEKVQDSRAVSTMKRFPILRGVISFLNSLILGMTTLSFSASFYEDEDGNEQELTKGELTLTLAVSILLAVGIFMVLPYALSLLFQKFVTNITVLSLIEGAIRMVIFLAYVWAISLTKDIRRVYMYHGAEHKCINCVEHGMPLSVENVQKSSRFHRRCGTSFLLIVMVISILVFACIRTPSPIMRLVLRLLLVPVVAGLSYEAIRFSGKTENKLALALTQPGIWLQHLTTKEPEDDMVEVAIASVEAVFDWEGFLAGKDASSCFPKEVEAA